MSVEYTVLSYINIELSSIQYMGYLPNLALALILFINQVFAMFCCLSLLIFICIPIPVSFK